MQKRTIDKIVFLAFGFSGAASLIYEVVWTRSLSTIMGSSTYALSTMLAAFMAGLSLGGWIGSRLTPRVRNLVVLFALCEFGIGIAGLVIFPLMRYMTPVFIASYYAFHLSFGAFLAMQFLISFIIMGIPTTLMGMTFPAVVKHMTSEDDDVGRVSGRLYSINTLGAIIGSIFAGFLLIPLIGARMAELSAASINVLIAIAILAISKEYRKAVLATAAVSLVLVIYISLNMVNVPLFSYYTAPRFESYESALSVYKQLKGNEGDMLVYRHEGVNGEVSVTRSLRDDAPSPYMLINNGKLEGGDDPGFALLAYIPYFSHPRDTGGPMRAINIGLGSGNTLSSLAELPLGPIDCVELSRGIYEANRRYFVPGLFRDPRIRHISADGRNQLLVSGRKYDLVIVSPSWAVETPSAGLLTDEFFRLASSRLAEHGIFAFWVDYFLESDNDVRIILNTLSRSFRHSRVWSVSGTTGLIVTASNSPFAFSSYEVMRSVVEVDTGLSGRFMPVLEEEDIRDIPITVVNTDDRPVIEFGNARDIISGPAALHGGTGRWKG